MTYSRRKFLRQLSAASGWLGFLSLSHTSFAQEALTHTQRFHALTDAAAVNDETFWGWIKTQFTVSPNLLNLTMAV